MDEESPSYPHRDDFVLEELTTDGYASLLRIQRGRLKNREVFGPMRLHYGYFKLKAKDSHYLIARDKGDIVGAIGYTHDEREAIVVVFEMISLQDDVIRFLIEELLCRCENELGAQYVEVDVSAYAPRMQRTLLEFGFLPVAYVPALVFHKVERLDVVKMGRLYAKLDTSREVLIPEAAPISELVISSFARREVEPRIREAVDRVALFRGLSEEQQERLAVACEPRTFEARETIFEAGPPAKELHLVMAGHVEVYLGDPPEAVGSVAEGECLGELSTLSGTVHSATAVTLDEVETAVLSHEALHQLVRRRPDIGVLLYRNLAVGLGEKLQRSDMALLRKLEESLLLAESPWSEP